MTGSKRKETHKNGSTLYPLYIRYIKDRNILCKIRGDLSEFGEISKRLLMSSQQVSCQVLGSQNLAKVSTFNSTFKHCLQLILFLKHRKPYFLYITYIKDKNLLYKIWVGSCQELCDLAKTGYISVRLRESCQDPFKICLPRSWWDFSDQWGLCEFGKVSTRLLMSSQQDSLQDLGSQKTGQKSCGGPCRGFSWNFVQAILKNDTTCESSYAWWQACPV